MKEKPSFFPFTFPWGPLFCAWVAVVLSRFFLDLYRNGPSFDPFFPASAADTPTLDLFHRLACLFNFPVLIGIGFLVVGLFWSSGKRLFSLLGLRLTGPARFLFEVASGFVLVHWFWLGLGFTGLWSGMLGALVAVVMTALLLKDLWAVRGIRAQLPPLRVWDGAMVLVILAYGSFLFLQDLLPETFYDSLNYFLGIPAYWWGRHGITDQPLHLLSGYFHGGSLLYLNGFLLGGGSGAKVLAGFFLLASAFLVWAWAGEWGEGRQRWTSAALVLSFPLLYLNAWATRVDSLQVFVILLFFYAVQKILEGSQAVPWVFLSGLMAGLALAIKPTAIVPLLGGVAALGIGGKGRVFMRKGWFPWIGFAFLETGPWLLKNLVFTGDPFFPYLANRLGARPIPVLGYQRLIHENQQFLPMDKGLGSWLTLPWRLTMPGAGDGQFLGPLLLVVLPILVWSVVRKNPLRILAAAFWISAVLGLGLSHMLRFSLPVFTLGLFLAGLALAGGAKGSWRSFWPGIVLLNSLLCFPELVALSSNWSAGGPFWTGREDQAQYLSRRLGKPDMEMARFVNEELPLGSRILFVGDSRALYYDRQTLAQSVFDEPFFVTAIREGRDGAGILKKLREFGVTHVVTNQGLGSLYAKEYHQYEGLTPDQWGRLARFAQGGLRPLKLQGPVGLFEVRNHYGPWDMGSPNPFSLLPPQAEDCLAALNRGDRAAAKAGIVGMLGLFPQDPFWIAQRERLKAVSR